MIKFTAKGHKNLLATHRSTLEFTKDKDLTLQGDCIIGVSADFNSVELTEFVKNNKKFLMKITLGDFNVELIAESNPNYSDTEELVIRLGDFVSERTLGINASLSAGMLPRHMVQEMKSPNAIIKVTLHETA